MQKRLVLVCDGILDVQESCQVYADLTMRGGTLQFLASALSKHPLNLNTQRYRHWMLGFASTCCSLLQHFICQGIELFSAVVSSALYEKCYFDTTKFMVSDYLIQLN